jgi:hypothetical protein
MPGCELQCTTNAYRRVGRWTEEAVLDCMEARLAARPEILKQRREIAEHPFGSIKHHRLHPLRSARQQPLEFNPARKCG